ncbi:hypothetical protein MCOR10_009546 [Pyricularia oryzae]|nr:hypothetical protein MCOR10_009546 [Pyricularia oryzae]KAI6530025.1 hypothetical protein MCOR05_007853 [Pyricularia oryzae]
MADDDAEPRTQVTEAGCGSAVPSSAAKSSEPMACVGCRSRKLKCSRDLPICVRCARLKIECVYPESRRKPLNKRKNVKELEARLALVEDLLKDAGANPRQGGVKSPSVETIGDVNLDDVSPGSGSGDGDGSADVEFAYDSTVPPMASYCSRGLDQIPNQQTSSDYFNTQELMGLGMFEVPPPFDVVDEMHTQFFQQQHTFIPIVHPARYLKSFHSAPHMRPPMALQYAIWAMAAFQMDKYSAFHDPYYRRARQYLEADELKGVGEHFITIQHAQAWVLVAAYEARTMHFTRAAMSCARGVKLCHMMGLHRLDEPGYMDRITPTILPPQSWVELEERRRVFWGAFIIDSHASVSTGWPSMIEPSQIATNVPSSHDAFVSGKEEETARLKDLFFGASYSTFAASVGICHIFNQLLAHVAQIRPDDRPQDLEYGNFWKRHRDIDNTLSSSFMFLPDGMRLPKNNRNPAVVFMNLNLHASVICLHQCAIDRAQAHELPDTIAQSSIVRVINSADEIVNIVKQAVQVDSASAFRNPLVALSLYCAASVYMYVSSEPEKDGKEPSKKTQVKPSHLDALEFLIQCLVAISRIHAITQSFLRQITADLDHYNLAGLVRLPPIEGLDMTKVGYNIPLLARTSLANHAKVQSPLPGYLPLGKPMGQSNIRGAGKSKMPVTWLCQGSMPNSSRTEPQVDEARSGQEADGNRGKRRRMSKEDSTGQLSAQDAQQVNSYYDNWQYASDSSGLMEYSDPTTSGYPQQQQQQQQMSGLAVGTSGLLSSFQTALPHRNSNSSCSSPAGVFTNSRGSSDNTPATATYSTASVASDGGGLFGGPPPAGLADEQTVFITDEMWNTADIDAFVQSASSNQPQVSGVGTENQPVDVSWNFMG